MEFGGKVAHCDSSESSPQSFSPSHLQVFKTHLLLRHLNSFGSQKPPILAKFFKWFY